MSDTKQTLHAAERAILDKAELALMGRTRPDNHGRVMELVQAALAYNALVEAPNEPAPATPPRRTFTVTGTAHFADGFDLKVEARTEDEARAIAIYQVTHGVRATEPELQEVCIENIVEEKEE